MQRASSKFTICYFGHPTAASVRFVYDTLTVALVQYEISKYRTTRWYSENYNYTAGKAQSPNPEIIFTYFVKAGLIMRLAYQEQHVKNGL